jgi:hypothetical protein
LLESSCIAATISFVVFASTFVADLSSGHSSGLPWWGAVATLLALVISAGALWSSHVFQRRAALARLLERYEVGHFHVRIWRVEQVTRGAGNKDSWIIQRRTIREIEESASGNLGRLDAFHNALAMNWKTERFDMQELYFFALQMRTWLPSIPWFAKRSIRKLNGAFGYQLLSTFLDQRVTACRLLPNPDHAGVPPDAAESYYPTHYGLFDAAYTDVVNWLAKDLFHDRNNLPPRIKEVLSKKHENIEALVATLSPQASSGTEPPPTLEDIISDDGGA